jgi:aspartate/tyrosine/aromatic aminotransferase
MDAAKGKLIPLLDNAYQGYASGQLAKDGYSQQLKLDCHLSS